MSSKYTKYYMVTSSLFLFVICWQMYQMKEILPMSSSPMQYLTSESDAYDDDCPRDFLIPGCSVEIYLHLRDLGFPSNCNQFNCSKCIPPNAESKTWLNDLYQTWYIETYLNPMTERQRIILELLQRNNLQSGHHNAPIILTVFNYGFLYLFLNWACSLDVNGMSSLRDNALIIVSDDKSLQLVQKYDFKLVLNMNNVSNISTTNLHITEEASKEFGADSFNPLCALQMIVLSDLIALGYDVLMMDVDVIFHHNPLKYITNNLHQWVDIWTMLAPRYDAMGFANTGFIIMRSNCKTKQFMETILQHITTIVTRTDQQSFNFWLYWKPFRQLSFKLLDRDLFIGGNDVRLRITKSSNLTKYEEFIVFHAFGTRDHFDKIHKFHQIGHWYFTKDKCPHIFDAKLVPDVNDRMEDPNDRESSFYLLKHNLVTDRFNAKRKMTVKHQNSTKM
eukprot:50233_1